MTSVAAEDEIVLRSLTVEVHHPIFVVEGVASLFNGCFDGEVIVGWESAISNTAGATAIRKLWGRSKTS